MQNNNDYSKRLNNVIDSLVDDVLNAPDEEFLNWEIDGLDEDIKTFRKIIQKNVEEYNQEKLKSLSADYENAISTYQIKAANFTQNFKEKMDYLLSKIKGNKDLENRLTLAFREKKGIDEDDLDSLISDLHNLNLLDENEL